MKRRRFVLVLGGALSLFGLCAVAQESHFGVDHDKWHQDFYAKLRRNDGGGSRCSQMDCRPTQSRKISGYYEVKVDGEWIPVPESKINHVDAPDGGAHVCAPEQIGHHKGELFCVILPPEG